VLGRIVNRFEEGFIALLLVTMTLLVFVEVVMRFGFDSGVLWMEELTLHISAWMVLFGASYGVKVGAHIGVDAVVKIMPPGLQRIAGIAAVLLCLLYCALFLYGGWIYLSKLYTIDLEMEDIEFPLWAAHSILIIGFVLLAVRFLEVLRRILKGETSGFELPDEAAEALEHLEQKGGGERSP
jgi:C4-dicarboxylate transporter DctQ subunit